MTNTDLTAATKPNGEIIQGDFEPDGRVVLYIIKGERRNTHSKILP